MRVVIVAGTMDRAERLRQELGIDAFTWSTYNYAPGRGFCDMDVILVDESARWTDEVAATLQPCGGTIYRLERV